MRCIQSLKSRIDKARGAKLGFVSGEVKKLTFSEGCSREVMVVEIKRGESFPVIALTWLKLIEGAVDKIDELDALEPGGEGASLLVHVFLKVGNEFGVRSTESWRGSPELFREQCSRCMTALLRGSKHRIRTNSLSLIGYSEANSSQRVLPFVHLGVEGLLRGIRGPGDSSRRQGVQCLLFALPGRSAEDEGLP